MAIIRPQKQVALGTSAIQVVKEINGLWFRAPRWIDEAVVPIRAVGQGDKRTREISYKSLAEHSSAVLSLFSDSRADVPTPLQQALIMNGANASRRIAPLARYVGIAAPLQLPPPWQQRKLRCAVTVTKTRAPNDRSPPERSDDKVWEWKKREANRRYRHWGLRETGKRIPNESKRWEWDWRRNCHRSLLLIRQYAATRSFSNQRWKSKRIACVLQQFDDIS